MRSINDLGGKPVYIWTDVSGIEEEAYQQLGNISNLPWVYPHVAVMPDVHFGKGATVGSVIPMLNAVAPSAVGVDIGCGMAAVRTSLTANDLPENLFALRCEVEAAIPVAHNGHSKVTDYSWGLDLFREWNSLHDKVQTMRGKAQNQMGTLGGGNHFIELCLDEEDRVWLFLHSGSRNIGKTLADIHINIAKSLAHNADLPDRDLAVFLAGTPEMNNYRRDLFWAQRYAAANREGMLLAYKNVMRKMFPHVEFNESINCHHNYVSEETHYGQDVLITRKGAISAREGEYGLIPGSMGTKSYVVIGKGNAESFNSASHGAGRRMSRTQARKTYSVADLIAQTEGVECRKDADIVDEIPSAYKDIDVVMANQSDLVGIAHTLRQIMCVKG
jgi:tRNA-splicing ligase RtcB